MSVHDILRTSTREEHAAVDACITLLNLQTTRGYETFLHAHLDALKKLTHAFRNEDEVDFSSLIGALKHDLSFMGANFTNCWPNNEQSVEPLHGLGVGYVIRGSRHGARIIKKEIPQQFPVEYLSLIPFVSWSGFLADLNGSESMMIEIVTSARCAFDQFLESTIRQIDLNESA